MPSPTWPMNLHALHYTTCRRWLQDARKQSSSSRFSWDGLLETDRQLQLSSVPSTRTYAIRNRRKAGSGGDRLVRSDDVHDLVVFVDDLDLGAVRHGRVSTVAGRTRTMVSTIGVIGHREIRRRPEHRQDVRVDLHQSPTYMRPKRGGPEVN